MIIAMAIFIHVPPNDINVDSIAYVDRPADGPVKIHFVGGGQPLVLSNPNSDARPFLVQLDELLGREHQRLPRHGAKP